MVKIAPSILSADFTRLTEEIRSIEKSGAEIIHLDVMDGRFVPNITFGPFIVKQIRSLTKLPLDTHLMIEDPGRYLRSFKDAGSDWITVHVETERHLHRTLQQIRALDCRAGVSINPHGGLDWLPYVADLLDLVLVMTVNPGFGAQKYIPAAAAKIRDLAAFRKKHGLPFDISVDGGINEETAREVIALGADILVAGNAFFSRPSEDRATLVRTLRSNAV
jgi:ribulose-phosphate 3-epimerase